MFRLIGFQAKTNLHKIFPIQKAPIFSRIKEFFNKKKGDEILVVEKEKAESEQKETHEDPIDEEEIDNSTKELKGESQNEKHSNLSLSERNLLREQALKAAKKKVREFEDFQKNKELINELLHEIKLEKAAQSLIELKPEKEIKTIYEKISIFEEFADGSIETTHIIEKGKKKHFKDYQTYLNWKKRTIRKLEEDIKYKLNPHDYWITHNYGTENAFTGEYWDTNEAGVYSCKVCTQRIFSSTHKYKSDCGYATFWNYFPYTVNFRDDNLRYSKPTQAVLNVQFENSQPKKRICCSNCNSHLGLVFDDGPAPFFKRILINSGSVKFLKLPWFMSPTERGILKREHVRKLKNIVKSNEGRKIKEIEKKLQKVINNFIESNLEFEKKLDRTYVLKNLEEAEEKRGKEELEQFEKRREKEKEDYEIQKKLFIENERKMKEDTEKRILDEQTRRKELDEEIKRMKELIRERESEDKELEEQTTGEVHDAEIVIEEKESDKDKKK